MPTPSLPDAETDILVVGTGASALTAAELGARWWRALYGDLAVKPNPSLAPLAKSPYYALPLFACGIGTNGGILTDEFGRALTEGGTPMGGLYAAGNCSSSVMGRSYPAAGATLGSGMTFGYLAARNALGIVDG